MNWYDRITIQQPASQSSSFPVNNGFQFQNPMQKAQAIMQAMRNPAEFVRQHIPDLPENIANNPDQILNYLQQTRGITQQQIQQIAQQNPYPGRF